MRVVTRTVGISGTVLLAFSSLSTIGTGEALKSFEPEKKVQLAPLPNGVTALRDFDRYQNSIYSFTRREFGKNPFKKGERPKTRQEFFDLVQKGKIGDVIYDDAEGGSLIPTTQQVIDLGDGTLENMGRSLAAPRFEKKDFVRAVPGHVYLIRAVDGNLALFRVLETRDGGCQIQWLYQPDGSHGFLIEGPFVKRPLGGVLIAARSMNSAVLQLRKRGLRICFEPQDGSDLQGELNEVALRDANLATLLDALVGAFPKYSWKNVAGTDVVCVFPKDAALLAGAKIETAENTDGFHGAWVGIVRSLPLQKLGIAFPAPIEMGINIPIPPDKEILVNAQEGDTLVDLLGRICWAYGEGMYFSVQPSRLSTEFPRKLVFETCK